MEEITLSDLEPININLAGGSGGGESNSLGGGIELLMNDKNKSANSSNVNLADLDKLEDELNDLSSINLNSSNFTPKPVETFNNFNNEPPITLKLDSDPLYADKMNDSKIGSSTVESMGNQSTWDGFAKNE